MISRNTPDDPLSIVPSLLDLREKGENPASSSDEPTTLTIKAATVEPLLCDFSWIRLL
tara:strand:+ start:1771 stop:1944 length:174 start_codon:yes stop_codon:yes gene_type:complete